MHGLGNGVEEHCAVSELEGFFVLLSISKWCFGLLSCQLAMSSDLHTHAICISAENLERPLQ